MGKKPSLGFASDVLFRQLVDWVLLTFGADLCSKSLLRNPVPIAIHVNAQVNAGQLFANCDAGLVQVYWHYDRMIVGEYKATVKSATARPWQFNCAFGNAAPMALQSVAC